MSDLQELYRFRVGLEGEIPTLMEYRSGVARKIVSLAKAGNSIGLIKPEHKVNGKWEYDKEAFNLANKYEEKSLAKKEKTAKTTTAKSALTQLSKAIRLATSTDTLTDTHILHIQNAYHDFMDKYGYVDTSEIEEEVNV